MQPAQITQIANRLRILSIRATTAAGSGHPTSCCSAAELVAAVFFDCMRMDPLNPQDRRNDRFILSKGHAAPLLYAAWTEAGCLEESELLTLRRIDSRLEGHPTPRLAFVDVATGSLGQGLAAGVGMAMAAQMDDLGFRTFVLMGDGEVAEGSVWEAASLAGVRGLGNLIALLDVNGFGQSQATAFGSDAEVYARRFDAFGWRTRIVNGHEPHEIQEALRSIDPTETGSASRPWAIIAKTVKGKGIPFAEGKNGWHGKVLKPDEAERVIRALERVSASGPWQALPPMPPHSSKAHSKKPSSEKITGNPASAGDHDFPSIGESVATREAFGTGLLLSGAAHESIVVLDGDVENSTHTELFRKAHPQRFFECYIAEQTLIGSAVGLSALGKIPFCATFVAFFTRAADQIRMAAVSRANLKLVGTHAGVSIGEDGVSQMGLEDFAFMRTLPEAAVLCAGDAVSARRLVEEMALSPGIAYLRVARPKTPVIYGPEETFEIGGAKVLRAHGRLAREGIPVTVIDAYSIKPLAKDLLREAIRRTSGRVITVEDHYPEWGLGDALAGELGEDEIHLLKLSIQTFPRSGPGEKLMALYRIDAEAIVQAVKRCLETGRTEEGSAA